VTAVGILGQVAPIITGVGAFGWAVSWATVRATRRKILAEAGKAQAEAGKIGIDATEVIQRSALGLAHAYEEAAQDARAEARAARQEARDATAEVTRLEKRVTELSRIADQAVVKATAALERLGELEAAIRDPQATLDGLRDRLARSHIGGVP
jgi:hypothetical protein